MALAACGPPANRLQGSAQELFTLGFDEVWAEWVMDELVVRYLSGSGRGGNEPVRISAPRAKVEAGGEISMSQARLEHFYAVREPDGRLREEPPFPPTESGFVRFDQVGPSVGQPVKGEFSATFQGGWTLGGRFDAALR